MWKTLTYAYLRRRGRRGPIWDVAPDNLGPMVAAIHPEGWTIDTNVTQLKVKALEPEAVVG